jgi:NAD-dependent dihydropyrimidine dehydrogenase PreA subunit
MKMAEKWYPVIDYSLCAECGTCVSFCPHGVYDVSKAPTPVVVNPQGCVDHCHGCEHKCPAGAISYVGDDRKDAGNGSCGCGCGCSGEEK